MMDRIKEDKRFFGVLGGLVLVLMVWSMMIRGPMIDRIDAQTRRTASLKRTLDEIAQRGAVSKDQIDPAGEAIKDLETRLAGLGDRIKFVKDGRFETPKDQSPMNHFMNLRIKSKELQDQAAKKGIAWNNRIQQLNFNPVPASDEEAKEQLLRLDLVYRVIEGLYSLSAETGFSMQRIEEINPMIPQGGQGQPAFNPDSFLNKIKVGIKFRCNGTTAFLAVHRLGTPDKSGRGSMCVEEFSIERPEATVNIVEVSLVVSALIVDPSKPLEGAPQ